MKLLLDECVTRRVKPDFVGHVTIASKRLANLTGLLLIAKSNRYEALKPLVPLALDALQSVNPGDVREIRLLQLLR